jgi:hypothetical protein
MATKHPTHKTNFNPETLVSSFYMAASIHPTPKQSSTCAGHLFKSTS